MEQEGALSVGGWSETFANKPHYDLRYVSEVLSIIKMPNKY